MNMLFGWLVKFNNKLVLSMLISWFTANVTEPIKEIIFVSIEDSGYYWVHECRKIPFRQLPKYIRDAKSELLPHQDLPTTDDVWRYCQEDNVHYIDFMAYAWNYLKQNEVIFGWSWQKEEYAIRHAEITKRIKMYNLMDDMKRPYIYLYSKRIKLSKLKELLEVKNYEKIVLPPIVPPEYMPKLDK
jgi:hypothetical protein